MNSRPVLLLLAGLGLTTGLPLSTALSAGDDEADVLYWVAPMDPNYRRDESGKSPMGMEQM